MLLIGMKMSLTKKPIKPIMAKPTDVACAIFENSTTKNEGAEREGHQFSESGAEKGTR